MCKRWDTPKDFALSQAWLFKVNRDVDVSSGSGDEYRVTTGFAKLVCAAQNAKMRHGPNLEHWCQASQNDLPFRK